MYRKCSKIWKLVAHAVIGWSTMSKGGLKKWLLERWANFPDLAERLERFRTLPSTFDFIVDLIEADMRKEDTYFRKTISTLKQVACALWR